MKLRRTLLITLLAVSTVSGCLADSGDGSTVFTDVSDFGDVGLDSVSDTCESEDLMFWYLDKDGDGYGMEETWVQECRQPSGYTPLAGDCNDIDKTSYPGASELCDGQDNNCNMVIDDDVTFEPCLTSGVCASAAPRECTDGALTECDYGFNYVEEETVQFCDTLDNDCDGFEDEGCTCVNGSECNVESNACINEQGFQSPDCPCAAGVAMCGASNEKRCFDPNTGQEVLVPFTNTEECGADNRGDGIDNNCDGVVDENCCGPTGQACNNEFNPCMANGGASLDENMNPIPDSCVCAVGVYACSVDTTEICVEPGTMTEVIIPFELTEDCSDMLDNDCDGFVNDGCP